MTFKLIRINAIRAIKNALRTWIKNRRSKINAAIYRKRYLLSF